MLITFTLRRRRAVPIGPPVTEQMREFVSDIDGVEKVHPKMIFDPPWSPEMMTEDAKFAFGLLSGLAMRFAGSAPAPLQPGLQP